MPMKLIVAARRRPGMSHRAYCAYVENVHGGIVAASPHDFAVFNQRYIQNHIQDGVYGSGTTTDYDSVSELWFSSPADMISATQHPYYRDTVAPDELNFGDQSNLIVLMTNEEQLRLDSAAAGSAAKIMHFVYRSAGLDREQFTAQWRDAITAALAGHALASRVCKAIISLPLALPEGASGDFAGRTPPNQYDGVASFSLAANDPLALDDIAAALEDALAGIQDKNRGFAVLVREVAIIDGLDN